MKVTVNNADKQQEKPFPKLMIATDCENPMIVLFFSKKNAIVIDASDSDTYKNFDKYDMAKKWFHVFTDFNGSITLSND